MVDKRKLIRIRNISIGAITGALVTGVPTIALASLGTGLEYIDLPFHQDKCPGYEVTTRNFHIDTMIEGENEVIESEPKVLYLNEDEIDDLLGLSFKTYDQYSERIVNRNSRIAREENYYEYYDILTDEEVDTIINQFKNGEFREISDNADIKHNEFDIAEYLLPEELDNESHYSADLTINTVNYDKSIPVTEEDLLYYNIVFFGLVSIGAIGGCFPALFDSVDEERERVKVKTKEK